MTIRMVRLAPIAACNATSGPLTASKSTFDRIISAACMGVSLSRVHHAIFVVLCCFILLFDPCREHSSIPTAHCRRRRAQRRSRTALLQRRRRLVLDGREHDGRLPVIGWSAAMIRGEPAIGREQSREPRLYSVEPTWGLDHEAVMRFCGQGSEPAGPIFH